MNDNMKKEQIKAIKERLNRAVFSEHQLNLYKLEKAIKEREDIFDVSYNTLASALNYEKTSLDLGAVIAICRCLDLDTAFILSPPGTPDPGILVNDAGSGKFCILDDLHYFGLFHGFFYTPHPDRDELIRFDLEIKKELDSAIAILTYYGRPVNVRGEVQQDIRKLRGIPFFDKQHSNIYIQFTNDQGDFYFFYFDRKRFRSHDLYFCRGIAITASSVTPNPPLLQNFVLFALEVPESKLQYIPGLLTDTSPVFHISEKNLTRLRSKYTIVDTFCQNFSHILDHDTTVTFPISEANILSSNSPNMDRQDIVKALLLLKGASVEHARHVYDELDAYSTFSKNYLQQPD